MAGNSVENAGGFVPLEDSPVGDIIIVADGVSPDLANASGSSEQSGDGERVSEVWFSGETVRNGISLLNLLFVIFAFSAAQRNRARDKSEDREKEGRAISAFWYQKIVLEPSLTKVAEFFTMCRAEGERVSCGIAALKKNGGAISALQELLTSFNSQVTAEKRKLVASLIHPLYVVDRDLANRCAAILDEAQDEISGRLDHVSDFEGFDEVSGKLDSLKVRMLSELYRSHLDSCGPVYGHRT